MKNLKKLGLAVAMLVIIVMTAVACQAPNFVVTFDANGGTPAPASQTLLQGDRAVEPTAPEKEGYNFGGWFTDAELTTRWNFEIRVVTNMTLYAKWTPKRYTVTFSLAGAGGAVPAPIANVEHGSSLSADQKPDTAGVVMDGHSNDGNWYIFDGTNYGAAYVFGTTQVTNNITLALKWTPNKYTVSFDLGYDGATNPAALTDVTFNTTIGAPTAPTRDTHDFVGWFVGATQWNFATDKVTSDITLTAKWTPKAPTTFGITFEANKPAGATADVVGLPEDKTGVASGATLASLDLDDPTLAGYKFLGWFLSTDTEEAVLADTFEVTDNITLKAKWVAVYTVTFDVDGATPTAPADIPNVEHGNTISLPAATGYTKTGYSYDSKWYIFDGSSFGAEFTSSTSVTSNLTLKLKWVAVYDVTFDSNLPTTPHGVLAGMPDNLTGVVTGTELGSVSSPTLVGYTFGGWYDNADSAASGAIEYESETLITSSVTLYAKWTPVNYTITFNGNIVGLTDVTADDLIVPNQITTAVYGDTLASLSVTNPNLTTKGYTFAGWYRVSTPNPGTDLEFTSTTQITESVTLYAKWTRITYTVTFEANAADNVNPVLGLPAVITIDWTGEVVSKPSPDPTQEGFVFEGWYQEATCTTPFDFSAKISAYTQIFAKWTATSVHKNTMAVVDGGGTSHNFATGELIYHNGYNGLTYAITGAPTSAAVSITVSYAATEYYLPYYLPVDADIYQEYVVRGNDSENYNYALVGNYTENAGVKSIVKGALGAHIGIVVRYDENYVTVFVDAAESVTTTFDVKWSDDLTTTYTVIFDNLKVTPAPVTLSAAYFTRTGNEFPGFVDTAPTVNNHVYVGIGLQATRTFNEASLGANTFSDLAFLFDRLVSISTPSVAVNKANAEDSVPVVAFDHFIAFGNKGGAASGGVTNNVGTAENASLSALYRNADHGNHDSFFVGMRIGASAAGATYLNESENDQTYTTTIDLYAVAPAAAIAEGAAPRIYLGSIEVEFTVQPYPPGTDDPGAGDGGEGEGA